MWDRPAPKKSGTTQLDSAHRERARKRAQRAGRHYPNLVDNMHEATAQKKQKKTQRKSS